MPSLCFSILFLLVGIFYGSQHYFCALVTALATLFVFLYMNNNSQTEQTNQSDAVDETESVLFSQKQKETHKPTNETEDETKLPNDQQNAFTVSASKTETETKEHNKAPFPFGDNITPNETEDYNTTITEESLPNGEEEYKPIDVFLSHVLKRIPLSEDSNIPCNSYSETDGATINVRGKNYLNDKAKIRSKPNCLKLCGVEVVKSAESLMHIMTHPEFKPRLFLQQKNAPSVILVNFIVWADHMFHFCLFFEVPEKPNENLPDYIYDQINAFINGSDEYRIPRLKVMGVCSVGSWFIKKMVGNVPAILCNKITTTFHKGPKYFEIDVDVNSSRVATSMFSKIRSAFRSLCIDLHFWLEGKKTSELPEQIWTGVRIYYIDMEKVIKETLTLQTWTQVNSMNKSIEDKKRKLENESKVNKVANVENKVIEIAAYEKANENNVNVNANMITNANANTNTNEKVNAITNTSVNVNASVNTNASVNINTSEKVNITTLNAIDEVSTKESEHIILQGESSQKDELYFEKATEVREELTSNHRMGVIENSVQ